MERRSVKIPQRALDLQEAERKYLERFGKAVPEDLLRAIPLEVLLEHINTALETNQAVSRWDKLTAWSLAKRTVQ